MSTPDRLSAALAGRYRIERELGAGGMATVYLAEDLKHDRKVAIKVLKPELAAVLGAERFVVEIKTTAAMSHPHILPLFDSGTADGFLFYVMPYIQGETIREKLNRETQFGVDEAVRIAREVADALDYAHRHGVIHRDIKPENILLHDGRAMVMDFGIALAVSAAAGGRMTETGLSLGTPHYMSPEQATAEKEITARSDQYSLASVLYEMLAGDPPFVASAAQAVIMKIITEPAASVATRRKNVPGNVDAALAKALEKLPADRFESAKAFADALANPAFTAGGAQAGSRRGVTGAYVPRQWFVAAAVALVTTIVALGWSLSRVPAILDTPVIRTTLELGPGATLRDAGGAIAITRDGSRIAYVTRDSAGTHVLIRRTDELVGRELVNRQVHSLAFSFDGRWLSFLEGVKLMKVSVDGGPVVQVADMTGLSGFPRGLTWTSRGDIIAGWSRGAHIVAGSGGAMRPAFSVPDSFPNGLNPIALPDPDAIAYTAGRSFETSRLAFASLASGKVEITNIPCAQVLGVLHSRLIYVTGDGALMALPFDVERSRLAGEPEPLGSEVRTGGNFGAVAALSASGTLVFNRGMFDQQLLLVSPTDGAAPLYKEVRGYAAPRFSPDGKRVAVRASNAGATELRDIWVYDIAARTFSLLASVGVGGSSVLTWSPDGKRVFFLKSVAEGLTQIMAVPSDGSGAPEVVAKPSARTLDLHVSPDGKRIIYSTGTEIASRGLSSDTTSGVLVSGPGRLREARTSPDGRWLAYTSDETGQQQIYVRRANGTGAKVQVSDGVGFEPMWSRSGRSLYFRRQGQLVEVPILPGAAFAVGTPRVVVRGEYSGAFDVTPDGRAFVMVGSANAIASPVIIHNWGRGLREKLGQAAKP